MVVAMGWLHYNRLHQGARACLIRLGLFRVARFLPPTPLLALRRLSARRRSFPGAGRIRKMLDRAMRWIQLALVEKDPTTSKVYMDALSRYGRTKVHFVDCIIAATARDQRFRWRRSIRTFASSPMYGSNSTPDPFELADPFQLARPV
jgi:hypothetical protein